MSLGEWWRERRAASDRAVAEWSTGLVVFQVLAVAAGIALISFLIDGELSWPVIIGGALGFLIFIWSSRRGARVERDFERPPGED
jgi:hypothetical protein